MRPGRYRIGGWEADQPAAHLTLPGFWIARVPITVAQFAAFIDSGGYRERNWWTSKGWRWRVEQKCTRPSTWRQPPDNSRPMQAVTGVSWYEARAFCAWLSAHLRLPHSDTVRLPSEAEWEAAAAFDATWQRRTYPWGEAEPTTRHAVFGQSWESGAPDVATRPAGASACGALDLVGTVWEWTSSRYGAYPDGAATVVDDRSTDDGDVPLRGGSWWDDSSSVRCGARNWGLPFGHGIDDPGLRVVVSPLARSDVLVS